MDFSLFGYTLSKKEKTNDKNLNSFAPRISDDGAIEIETDTSEDVNYAISHNYLIDFETNFTTKEERIGTYRRAATFTEVDYAIIDIINEAIVQEQNENAISLSLDDATKFSKSIKDKILDQWEEITRLLNLNNDGNAWFKRWYIDGELYFNKIINEKKPNDGIQEIRYIDPRRIAKIRQNIKGKNEEGKPVIVDVKEFYIFSLKPLTKEILQKYYAGQEVLDILSIQPDEIAYAHSGLVDIDTGEVRSYLHKALKPLNQLNLIEDSLVIYRLARAPERRIFYIDVGNLPKTRAEQYMRDIATKYKSKIVYNTSTGTANTKKNILSMLEDIWLPRREGNRATEVETLQGGQNLGEIEDITYFKNKLYRSLNIPISRLEPENAFNLGRTSEITRDELRFSKFVEMLRKQFNDVLYDLLRTQLILKKIITDEDWELEKHNIKFLYNKDSYFEELKNQDIINSRVEILERIDAFSEKYFSQKWIKQNVLMQSDEEMEEIQKEIEEQTPDEDTGDEYGYDEPRSFEPRKPAVQEPAPEPKEPEPEPDQPANDKKKEETNFV